MGPIIKFLRERPTLILKEPLIKMLLGEAEKIKVDREISREELVEAIKRSAWARGIAEGLAKKGGLKPCTEEYHKFVDTLSRAVAEGFVESI